MDKNWVFDSDFAQDYTKARQALAGDFLAKLKGPMGLSSALDMGCGVGHFSKFLTDLGLRVVAVDGREQNAAEGQKRYPKVRFLVKNVEDPDLPTLGLFDLVLCVGLLYHLENPFRVVRSLHSLTGKLLILDAMCAPGKKPGLQLVDEMKGDDQGLNYVAFYPTEACLVKMLYRAGFPFVYGFRRLPRHPYFQASLSRRRERTMLVASKEALTSAELRMMPNVVGSWEILWIWRERWWHRLDHLARASIGMLRRSAQPVVRALRSLG